MRIANDFLQLKTVFLAIRKIAETIVLQLLKKLILRCAQLLHYVYDKESHLLCYCFAFTYHERSAK